MRLKNLLIWPFVKKGKVVTKIVRNSNTKMVIKKEPSLLFVFEIFMVCCHNKTQVKNCKKLSFKY